MDSGFLINVTHLSNSVLIYFFLGEGNLGDIHITRRKNIHSFVLPFSLNNAFGDPPSYQLPLRNTKKSYINFIKSF